MTSLAQFGVNAGDLPQDPFVEQVTPEGPSFLDTGACLCALQETPVQKSNEAVWHCIGNQTQGVYETRGGKWFSTVNGGTKVNGSIYDASNGPNTDKTLLFESGFLKEFEDSDESLSVYDQACTGKNQSTYSTAFYRTSAALARNETPGIDGAPCRRPGAVPVKIQDVDDWLKNGCSEGFLCANNTVNSLPQYCPPIDACQSLRLSGQVCQLNGETFAMGPFEPILCQAGHYCPPDKKGKEMVTCPAGSYCQPGASTPTPCNVGSRCPEGSSFETFLIPIIVAILIDILLIIMMLLFRFRRGQRASNSATRLSSLKRRPTVGGVKATITGYKQLSDDADHEMAPLEPSFKFNRADTFTGFEAALEPGQRGSVYLRKEVDADLNPHLRAFVDSMRKATDATDFGLSFSYSGLNFHPKGSPRPILQNVTGTIDSGTLAAVMGGSGAGKSTFVNVLMGKTTNTGGVVAINNNPGKMKRYKKVIGYVPQDDVVLPELTVYENIVHSARIRLPRTWSNHDIELHVESVIDCLELSHVRDSLVGSVGKPVISGGQRKRVSIGMELAAAPMAIFLDEPTSGLDATAASSIMRTLKALARLGISVIVIIHQPRSEIFDLFDRLILLGNGQTIYEGSQRDVKPFFEGMGFQFPEHSNHGDIMTDIITGNGRDYKATGDVSKEALIAHWASYKQGQPPASNDRHTLTPMGNSAMHRALKTRGAPRLKQVWLCLRRAMLQQYRTKAAFWAEMGLATLAGFLLGLAQNPRKGILFTGLYQEPYGILSTATDYASAPQLALLVAIAIGLVAGAPGVKIFSEETLLHRRESEAGHSRIAYFLAKCVSVLPRMLLGCLHFSTMLFLLSHPIINWGLAFLTNFCYFYCIYGLASIVSMLARREDAPLFATMISLIIGILSGAAPPLAQAKEWHLEWLWRASPGVWLAELYFGQLVSPFRYLFQVDLAAEITGFHLKWVWQNLGILVAIGTVYRVLAFIGMWAGHRLRR